MDSITLQNYRCFGSEEQTARLAPLTLLVGPNSTGKTSFLALIRALWDVAFREVAPNFREEPYDLGSWDDIVHRVAIRGKSLDEFSGGFQFTRFRDNPNSIMKFTTCLGNTDGSPFPMMRTITSGEREICIRSSDDGSDLIRYRNEGETVERPWPGKRGERLTLLPFRWFLDISHEWGSTVDGEWRVGLSSEQFKPLLMAFTHSRRGALRPLSSAPTRSQPHRTYDPALVGRDPEGDYIPSYLANLSRRNADEWQLLKSRLEDFGKASELFNEIAVRSFGKSDGDPFQIQVRKFGERRNGRRRKGPWRNLIDVGYGVSQALPVLTELLRPDGPTMFLLQQPEVHLHPQAQAALGTLFCQVAAGGRQLIIETHSDYIIDRVRMDVRDGTTGLKPEDVSILYFEPGDLNVKIHSIRIDDAGNVKGAPEGYRQFFTDEMMRSIWV